MQLDSAVLISEAFRINTTSACVEQLIDQEAEKLQKLIETLETQVS